jgi:prepilin-type N-terminal cleavage/methylation domain-containing protein
MKYFKKIIANNKGFTLVEIMIAAGLMGVLSLGIMQIFENITKGNKKMNLNQVVDSTLYSINLALRTEVNCRGTLTNLDTRTMPAGCNLTTVPTAGDGCPRLTAVDDYNADGTFARRIATASGSGLPAAANTIIGQGSGSRGRILEMVVVGSRLLAGQGDTQTGGIWIHFNFDNPTTGAQNPLLGRSADFWKLVPLTYATYSPTGLPVLGDLNVADNDPGTMDSCSQAASTYMNQTCDMLNGTYDQATLRCKDISIEVNTIGGYSITGQGNALTVGNHAINGYLAVGATANASIAALSAGDIEAEASITAGGNLGGNALSIDTEGVISGALFVGGIRQQAITTGQHSGSTMIFNSHLQSDGSIHSSDNITATNIIQSDSVIANNIHAIENIIVGTGNDVVIDSNLNMFANHIEIVDIPSAGIDSQNNWAVTQGWVKDYLADVIANELSDAQKQEIIDAIIGHINDNPMEVLADRIYGYLQDQITDDIFEMIAAPSIQCSELNDDLIREFTYDSTSNSFGITCGLDKHQTDESVTDLSCDALGGADVGTDGYCKRIYLGGDAYISGRLHVKGSSFFGGQWSGYSMTKSDAFITNQGRIAGNHLSLSKTSSDDTPVFSVSNGGIVSGDLSGSINYATGSISTGFGNGFDDIFYVSSGTDGVMEQGDVMLPSVRMHIEGSDTHYMKHDRCSSAAACIIDP